MLVLELPVRDQCSGAVTITRVIGQFAGWGWSIRGLPPIRISRTTLQRDSSQPWGFCYPGDGMEKPETRRLIHDFETWDGISKLYGWPQTFVGC